MSKKEDWQPVLDVLERAESDLAEAMENLDSDNDVARQLRHLQVSIGESLFRVKRKIEALDAD